LSPYPLFVYPLFTCPSPTKERNMPEISRRRFLRDASVGAAAVGAVAAGGAGVFAAIGGNSAGAAPLAFSAESDTPALEGSGVLAHVDNAKTGEMTIFVGTKEIKFTSRDLAQQLLRAAQ
jgi:hypothetical protein